MWKHLIGAAIVLLAVVLLVYSEPEPTTAGEQAAEAVREAGDAAANAITDLGQQVDKAKADVDQAMDDAKTRIDEALEEGGGNPQ